MVHTERLLGLLSQSLLQYLWAVRRTASLGTPGLGQEVTLSPSPCPLLRQLPYSFHYPPPRWINPAKTLPSGARAAVPPHTVFIGR